MIRQQPRVYRKIILQNPWMRRWTLTKRKYKNVNRYPMIYTHKHGRIKQRITQIGLLKKMMLPWSPMTLALKCQDRLLKAVDFYHKINIIIDRWTQVLVRTKEWAKKQLKVFPASTWVWSLIGSRKWRDNTRLGHLVSAIQITYKIGQIKPRNSDKMTLNKAKWAILTPFQIANQAFFLLSALKRNGSEDLTKLSVNWSWMGN